MAGRLRTIDARTLADAVLEPPGYAVKDLLVQGLHILAGAPKTGKSWLALWLCQQVAGGEKVWGYPTQQGTVLYLCLEDGYHRLQDRLLDITEDPSENLCQKPKRSGQYGKHPQARGKQLSAGGIPGIRLPGQPAEAGAKDSASAEGADGKTDGEMAQ